MKNRFKNSFAFEFAVAFAVMAILLVGINYAMADRTTTVTTSTSGGADYPFPGSGNSTTTLTAFNGGLTSYASTTIGNGLQAGGLTVSGGATTTGNVFFGTGAALWTVGPNSSLSNALAITSAGMTYPAVTVGTTGNFGIGSTSPDVLVSIMDTSGFASVANHLVLSIASSTRGVATSTHLAIDAQGNVGWGTSTPNALIDLNSPSNFNGFGMINFEDSTRGGLIAQIAGNSQSNSATGGQLFFNFPGTSSGTSNGGEAVNWLALRFNGANNKLFTGDNGSKLMMQSPHPIFITAASSNIPNATTSPTELVIDTTNRVGVGTSSPFAKLSVHGNPSDGTVSTMLFAVSSSTAAATTTLFSVSNIGTTTMGQFGTCSGANALQTSSTGVITCGAVSSDPRLKKDMQPIVDAGEVFNQVHPISYYWVEADRGTAQEFGFNAKEVQAAIPQAVETMAATELTPGGTLEIKLPAMVALLWRKVQEQQTQIDGLGSPASSESTPNSDAPYFWWLIALTVSLGFYIAYNEYDKRARK